LAQQAIVFLASDLRQNAIRLREKHYSDTINPQDMDLSDVVPTQFARPLQATPEGVAPLVGLAADTRLTIHAHGDPDNPHEVLGGKGNWTAQTLARLVNALLGGYPVGKQPQRLQKIRRISLAVCYAAGFRGSAAPGAFGEYYLHPMRSFGWYFCSFCGQFTTDVTARTDTSSVRDWSGFVDGQPVTKNFKATGGFTGKVIDPKDPEGKTILFPELKKPPYNVMTQVQHKGRTIDERQRIETGEGDSFRKLIFSPNPNSSVEQPLNPFLAQDAYDKARRVTE
jgi:hypothetical protein